MVNLSHSSSALILIDLQQLDVDPSVGALSLKSPSEQANYQDAIWSRVIPNASSALNSARHSGVEVIHIRIQSMTHDGRDRSPAHKRLNLHAAPHSFHAQFLPGVEPIDDEIVLNKTTSDPFHSTPLSYLLKNLGITHLYLLGVLTNECVASTARSACDLGFKVHIIREACAATSDDEHQYALANLHGRYADVISLNQFHMTLGVTNQLADG